MVTQLKPVATGKQRKAPRRRTAPTTAELIAQLRADLVTERAWTLRLQAYVEEVLEAELPAEAVCGWEPHDYDDYWHTQATLSLIDEDDERRPCREGQPVPVMTDPPPALPAIPAAPLVA